jgi:hypothetical protein
MVHESFVGPIERNNKNNNSKNKNDNNSSNNVIQSWFTVSWVSMSHEQPQIETSRTARMSVRALRVSGR